VDISEYVLECLREDGEFILYRGRASAAGVPSVLLLTLASTRPALESLKKIDNDFSFRDDLETTWALRPLVLSQYNGQKALVFEDPGGEPLDRLIQGPLEIRQFLRIAVGLATALRQLHKRKLIHKDVKPSNVLVESVTGRVWLTGFGIASRLPRDGRWTDSCVDDGVEILADAVRASPGLEGVEQHHLPADEHPIAIVAVGQITQQRPQRPMSGRERRQDDVVDIEHRHRCQRSLRWNRSCAARTERSSRASMRSTTITGHGASRSSPKTNRPLGGTRNATLARAARCRP